MATSARHAFVVAALHGDMDRIATLWQDGLVTDADCQSDQETYLGWTALQFAAMGGHTATARILLERGASTERRTHQRRTPLHLAAKSGHAEMVELLCRRGANVDARGLGGESALHLALSSPTVVACLLTHGASPNVTNDNGETPLDVACAIKDLATIKLLIASGADVLRLNRNHETALMRACFNGDDSVVLRMVEALDEAGVAETARALVNTPGQRGWTPLCVSATLGNLKVVECLVAHGAVVNTNKTAAGFSPLNSATYKCHEGVVQFLLASGADTESTDADGSTPLVVASKLGCASIVRMLLQRGVEINHKNMDGASALHAATIAGHAAIVELLLARGADPEIRDANGWTPLLRAVENEYVHVVRLLLDHGADVDCQGYDHWTPLAIAVPRRNVAVCELLLARGASTKLENTDGQTALHLAASSDHQEIVRLLLRAGADPKARDFHGRTAAYIAMMEGHFTTADLLASTEQSETDVYDDGIWPRHILHELYDMANTNKPGTKQALYQKYPPWYIDRQAITSIEPSPYLTKFAAQDSVGMWLGSRVVIVEPAVAFAQPHATDEKKMMKRLFRREVSQLYPLRHPHVIKLYGACHRGDNPFLVMEYAQSGTLRSYVGNHKHRTWAILHEVALGVQYLHERGIVHRGLMGDNIYIGDDGLVKISAFGAYSMAFGSEATLEWRAPEELRKMKATVASDIYALGMCIIEAVTGKSPYATEVAEKQDVKELVAYGVPPTKSVAFSTHEWEFVLQMICFRPHKRLKISDVVRELAAHARDEAQEARRTAIDPVTKCDMEALFTVARSHIRVNSYEAAVSDRDMETRSETPQHQVFDRLHDAWRASKNLPPSHLSLVLPRLQDLITRFTKDAEAQANGGLAASFAAQRQHADRIFSFQNEIDRLLEQHSELLKTTTQPTHAWRTQWYAHRHAQLRAFGAVLERVDSLDVETCTCLLNELTKRRDAYTSIPPPVVHAACIKMRSMRGVRVPDWFVPHYEVSFDAFQSFSRGSFGSVHHGEWMGARVVIKKVFSAEDDNDDDEVTTEFQKEVEIWSRLYHPHVLQLLGACHVGQKFLLSEFAAQGQLDRYLRGLDPLRRTREVWRTLHEAALGLQYLHSRGVVHCDLKCNNILVGQDGKAKLSDYGLSRQQPAQPEPELASDSHTSKVSIDANPSTRVGAPRWKAPEVLNGAEPTMASDVYSFGMCIVEAVSGEYPWGPRDRDELVSDHVRQGGALFSKPRGFSEVQWALVVGACRFDPTERLSLSEIVGQLQVFVNDADRGTERAGDACSKLDEVAESEPEVMTSWSDSGASSLATRPVAAAMSDSERANARDTSYSESWENCAP